MMFLYQGLVLLQNVKKDLIEFFQEIIKIGLSFYTFNIKYVL